MDRYVLSPDRVRIHYRVTGEAATALVFVHGWLGNADWWNAQRDYFADRYTVVQIELAGHGRSERSRTAWSAQRYADDIAAVVDRIDAREIVLVGHSMSGGYVVEAAPRIARTITVILVDTLKDLDEQLPPGQLEQILGLYRSDFKSAVENVLPRYLFANGTPPEVRSRIQAEFLANDPKLAVDAIEPLYKMDLRAAARRVQVPVRAINSDASPTNREGNRAYFRDFADVVIAGTGHYPMLERPDEFNRLLDGVLRSM